MKEEIFNFVDNNSRFIERDTGRLITEDGKYIDDDGFYIAYNEDGSTYRVDITGKKLDIKEEPEDTFEPFLDDDGSPVVLEEKPKTKTRRKRATKKTVDADA